MGRVNQKLRRVLWCIFMLSLWIPETTQIDYTKVVNMDGQDCDQQQGFTISDTDIINVKARPPQRPSGEGTRDSCTVELTVANNRRIRLYIIDLVIYECGTFIKIFDTEKHMVKPRWTLDCNSGTGMKFTTSYSRVLIKLEKFSVQSINFRYSIALTTSQGPDVDFEKSVVNWRQDILTDDAIAGIGIAAALVLLAFILIIIFILVRVRRKRQLENIQRASTKAASTTYSNTTFPSYASRHYTHNDSQEYSSVDSKDGPNSYSNTAYKPESPNKGVKSAMKSENGVYKEGKVDKSNKGFMFRKSRSGSTHSLDKPHLEYTDVSDVEYSDRDKSKMIDNKRNRSHRETERQNGYSENDRNESKDRTRERSRTRSDRSRLQSERDPDNYRERHTNAEHHREHSRHRESERERNYDSGRDYDRDRDYYRERERSQGRSRSESERRNERQRERDRSYPATRRTTDGNKDRSSSKPRSSSTSRTQPSDKYSSYSRNKTPSNGGRSDYSDGSKRHRDSERSNLQRQRSSSLGSRNDRNRSSGRRSRR